MNQRNVDAIAKVLSETGTDTYFSDARVVAEVLSEYMLVPSALTVEECEAAAVWCDKEGTHPDNAKEFSAVLERIAKGEPNDS